MLLVVATTSQLVACSKTVQWEEEVPLNTGETIWVKRSVDYNLKGGAGNPLDIAYRPGQTERLEFEWSGKKYVYEGDARVFLLAISPQHTPVLVAPAADKGWHWAHDYKCTLPFYVQLVPDTSGRNWSWPPAIEPWLFGLPHNLLNAIKPPGEMKTLYTAQQREKEDALGIAKNPPQGRIDPTYKVRDCMKGELK